VHVLYLDSGYKTAYATRTAPGTWTIETVPGYGARLRIDPQGTPVVLGRTATSPQQIQLVRRGATGTWTPEIIPTLGQAYPTDFRFDAQSRPHVLSWETLSGSGYWLRYSTTP